MCRGPSFQHESGENGIGPEGGVSVALEAPSPR